MKAREGYQPCPYCAPFLIGAKINVMREIWINRDGLRDAGRPILQNGEIIMTTKELWEQAHKDISYIFETLLPDHGLTHRPAQEELSHFMLDAMIHSRIALCDAGTGIGKTFSYLVAGIIYDHYRSKNNAPRKPMIISTSSIALQNAVKYEYLPLLSAALLDAGVINIPVLVAIRKGKSHYVCDKRLEQRLAHIGNSKKNPLAMEALEKIQTQLDMDEVPHLSAYDRRQICVPELCDCKRTHCRYRDYLRQCSSKRYLFQVCNHNLLFADAMHRNVGKKPIFPDPCALVLDESHKVPEVAREMLGVTLGREDIQTAIWDLRMARYVLAAEYLTDATKPLLGLMAAPPKGRAFSEYADCLHIPHQVLKTVNQKLCGQLTHLVRRNLQKMEMTMETLLRHGQDENVVCFAGSDEHGGTKLCATVYDLSGPMKKILWNKPQGMVLTSGTLAVGTDFSRFREETGLIHNGRVMESVSESPFDYWSNTLLYLPEYPPVQFGNREDLYFDALAGEIVRLIHAAWGHCLVLFNSYAAMSAIKERLMESELPYPLMTMDGNNPTHTVRRFKEQPSAILLATGAAWEGMDFPGDCVSLLVIPKLPFAFPDELKEKQKERYGSLHDFIQSVIVPEMQIKLRQGFGRAIRTETDTCVIAILDDRAGPKSSYHDAALEALPELPVTSCLEDVEQFMLARKQDHYFKESR